MVMSNKDCCCLCSINHGIKKTCINTLSINFIFKEESIVIHCIDILT